jgi:putative Mg2+ transporter-C (MgtC) family protein
MDTFFGLHLDTSTLGGMTVTLILSVVLSGLIGLEREIHGHPAGLRTHILVCLGSTLITLVSVHIAANGMKGDPARLSAQVVSGIGFLGAGAIIREGTSIRGLTTAASIWTTAAIGIAVGAGPFFGQMAVIAAVIVLFTLWALNHVEDRIDKGGKHTRTIEVQVHATQHASTVVLSKLTAYNVAVHSIEYNSGKDPHHKTMLMRVHFPPAFNMQAFISDLGDEPGVVAVSL